MLQENKIIELLPQVLSGDRLIEELGYLPAYNETIIEQSQASRLLALSDIYRVYVPSEMSIEIYNKLYLALLLSIKKKFTAAAVKQRYENAKMIKTNGFCGNNRWFGFIHYYWFIWYWKE